MSGNVEIQFSHLVLPLKLSTLQSKSPLALNIIWMKEEILNSEEAVPAYTIEIVSF